MVAVGPVGDRLRSAVAAVHRRGTPLVRGRWSASEAAPGDRARHPGDPAADDHLITTPRGSFRPGLAASFDHHSYLPPVPSGVVRRYARSIRMPAELRGRSLTNHPEAAADNPGQAAMRG